MIRMRIKIGLVALALVSGATNVRSQVFEPAEEPRTVRYHFHQTKRTKNSRIVAKNVKRPGKESIFSEAFGC